jgi:sporulation protein YlmC with PRC-barrel domain
MAHYAMLGDYQFDAAVDDIRGANVYGPNNEKLGGVDDVVFNHEKGEVRYLVVETLGSGRKHLLPAERVYRSVLDAKDFDVNLTHAEMENLRKPWNPRSNGAITRSDKGKHTSDLRRHKQTGISTAGKQTRSSTAAVPLTTSRRNRREWGPAAAAGRVGRM